MMNNPHQPDQLFADDPTSDHVRTIITTVRPIPPVRCFIEQLDHDGTVTQTVTTTLDPQHLAAVALYNTGIASVTVTYDPQLVDAGSTRFTRILD